MNCRLTADRRDDAENVVKRRGRWDRESLLQGTEKREDGAKEDLNSDIERIFQCGISEHREIRKA